MSTHCRCSPRNCCCLTISKPTLTEESISSKLRTSLDPLLKYASDQLVRMYRISMCNIGEKFENMWSWWKLVKVGEREREKVEKATEKALLIMEKAARFSEKSTAFLRKKELCFSAPKRNMLYFFGIYTCAVFFCCFEQSGTKTRAQLEQEVCPIWIFFSQNFSTHFEWGEHSLSLSRDTVHCSLHIDHPRKTSSTAGSVWEFVRSLLDGLW